MSLSVWQDTDPRTAERQLRGLNRRLSELEEALDACGDILSRNENDFTASLMAGQLREMQQRLLTERAEILQHRAHEHLEVVFSGETFRDSTARIEQFGSFLFRFQRFFQSIAQAVTSGPTPRGPISELVRELSAFRMESTFASSFGINLYIPSRHDLFGRSTAVRTLRILFSVLNDADNSEQLLNFTGELGSRAGSHFRKLARDLKKAEGNINLKWIDQAGIEYNWEADQVRIEHIIRNTNAHIDNKYTERDTPGILVGASLLKNTFEILDLERREIVAGHVTQAAWEQLSELFGRPVLVSLVTHTSTNSTTHEKNISHTATKFDDMTKLPADSPARLLIPKRFLT